MVRVGTISPNSRPFRASLRSESDIDERRKTSGVKFRPVGDADVDMHSDRVVKRANKNHPLESDSSYSDENLGNLCRRAENLRRKLRNYSPARSKSSDNDNRLQRPRNSKSVDRSRVDSHQRQGRSPQRCSNYHRSQVLKRSAERSLPHPVRSHSLRSRSPVRNHRPKTPPPTRHINDNDRIQRSGQVQSFAKTNEDLFFEVCASRAKKLQGAVWSVVQLQIQQVLYNAENPHLPPQIIVPLPGTKTSTQSVYDKAENACVQYQNQSMKYPQEFYPYTIPVSNLNQNQ